MSEKVRWTAIAAIIAAYVAVSLRHVAHDRDREALLWCHAAFFNELDPAKRRAYIDYCAGKQETVERKEQR